MMGRIYESFIASHENVMGIDETFIVLHPNGQMPKKSRSGLHVADGVLYLF
jgi:hypothetical protein